MHEVRIRTRWTDFDALGHITHAAYPVFLDEARDAYLTEAVGSFDQWPWVVAHVSIDYRSELPAGALYRVLSGIGKVGRSSLVTVHRMFASENDELAAECEMTSVYFDLSARASCPMPLALRDAATALLPAA